MLTTCLSMPSLMLSPAEAVETFTKVTFSSVSRRSLSLTSSSVLHRRLNVSFIVFISGLRCSNCTAAVPTGSNLCMECASRKLCDTCHKPLLPHSFDRDMPTCKSCVRRLTRPITRSALRRTVVEVEIPTFDYDLDLGVFLNNNAARITEILQQALDEHS